MESNEHIDLLRKMVFYDHVSGELYWNIPDVERCPLTIATYSVSTSSKSKTRKRYKTIFVLGSKRYAHRVAWAIYYGEWPKNSIDHIDGDGENNAIQNLRDVTHVENMRNKKSSAKSASSKVGVGRYEKRQSKKQWWAAIGLDNRQIHLGWYEHEKEAIKARVRAEKRYWGREL